MTHHLSPEMIACIREYLSWEIDVVPLAARIESEPGAMLTMTLVVAGGFVVAADLATDLESEATAVATAMAETLREAAAVVGSWPRRLCVRHEQLVAPLQSALAGTPVRVALSVPLKEIARVQHELYQEGSRETSILPVVLPERFGDWGIDPDAASQLFEAAAEYYRRAPWRWVENSQVLYAVNTDGQSLACVILGNGGIETGIAVHTDAHDLRTFLCQPVEEGFEALAGSIVTLTFDGPDDLPAAYVREFRTAGWVTASRDAIPNVVAINTLAGRLPAAIVSFMTILLRALPRYVDDMRPLLVGDEGCDAWPLWTDHESGVTIAYRGFVQFSEVGLWRTPDRLAPCLAEGPGARPELALQTPWHAEDNFTVMFRSAYGDVAGLIEAFVGWLSASGLSDETIFKHVRNTGNFLAQVLALEATPIEAITEYDLRTYLFDRCIALEDDFGRTLTAAAPVSLKKFFKFLATTRGLRCPWSRAVLDDRDAFEERRQSFPGRLASTELLEEWEDELSVDLDARLLLPDSSLARELEWSVSGPLEAQLQHELHRRWLLWRDEVVRAGVVEPELVRAALLPKQRAWERAPHPRLDGMSPIDAVRQERATAPK